jgi:pyruvate ferredoxin oxidoreductase gamma subunit
MRKDTYELRLHGRGGQGVVTLSELLAGVALEAGMNAQTMPFFGVERRGAQVKSSVRISPEVIKIRSQSFTPNILVLMHENLLPAALADGAHEEATFIVSANRALDIPQEQWFCDAVSIALANELVIDGEPYLNVPMLGALCAALKLPQDLMTEVIRRKWQGKTAEVNVKAATEGYENVRRQDGQGTKKKGAGKVAAAKLPATDEFTTVAGKMYFPLSEPTKGAAGKTGTWRVRKPIVEHDKCTGCGMCWIVCPEGTISRDAQVIDWDYCKGCGICAEECPVSAITMQKE